MVSMIIPIQAASAQVTSPTLYAVNDFEGLFYWIDFDPASPTYLQSTSSTITLDGDPIDKSEILLNGLTKAPDGTLYAATMLPESSYSTLITIDPITTAGITVGDIEDENGNLLLIEDIAHHLTNGKIFGVTFFDQGLYEIVPSTGKATFVCELTPDGNGEGESLAFIGDTLYRLDDAPFPSLETIDYASPVNTPPSCVTNVLLTLVEQTDHFSALTNTNAGLFGINANEEIHSFSVDSSGTWTATFIDNTGIGAGGLVEADIESSNLSPDAIDDSFDVNEDTPNNPLDVLANDQDENLSTLQIVSVGTTDNGGAVTALGTLLEYTPAPNFFGIETFTYTIEDEEGLQDSATVTVNVQNVNDPPTFTSDAPLEVNEEESYSYSITSSDIEEDSLEVTSDNPLPAWLTLTDAGDGSGSATLFGTPTWDDVGDHEITLHVFEKENPEISDVQTFTITVAGVVVPELQQNLNDNMIKQFEKKIDKWNDKLDKLEDRKDKLETKADKADAKGKLEKAIELRAKAADTQDKIEILQDMVSVLEMSIGKVSVALIPVELQDNLLPKSIDKIEHQIIKWMHKIAKLNYKADTSEEKAQKYLDKGKEEKAQKHLDKAAALRDKAEVFEDFIKVLKVAIDFDPSTVTLHDKYYDKDDKEDDKEDKDEYKWDD
jgi:hypothetical protein